MLAMVAAAVITAAVMLVAASVTAYLLLRSLNHRHAEQLRGAKQHADRERHAHQGTSRALEVRNELYDILFNNTRDMVFLFTLTEDGLPGPFVEVNDTACERLEYSRRRLLGMSVLDVEAAENPDALPPYSRSELVVLSDSQLENRRASLTAQPAKRLMSRILAEKHLTYNRMFQTRTGGRFPVELRAKRTDLMGRPMILCTVHDTTERRKAEQALQESETRFRTFFEHSPLGVAHYDAARKLVNVNVACLRLFGTPDCQEFARFDPFNCPVLDARVRAALCAGETLSREVTVDFDLIRDGNVFTTTRRGKAHFALCVQNLGHDAQHQPRGCLVEIQDITERRRAEGALRQSERQLHQAQKMEALGTLAGGIAHDFNNILTPILGYTEIMMHSMDKALPQYEFLEEIAKASYRARDLVHQILAFSRQGERDGKPIHIIPIVKEVIKLQRASVGENVEVDCDVRSERDVVVASPTQLHQVMMNLCTNAVYAMRDEGGRLEVVVTDFLLAERAKTEFPDLAPGRYMRLSIKDSGCGIDEATLESIFDPFFTTKPSGEGTGMGLAVVHGIVRNLKGTITVQSTRGVGTTFHVILPVIEQATAESNETRDAVPAEGEACILFVDDEPDVARLASRMLTALGYDTRISCNSQEALDMFREAPADYDLVITDYAMPELNGSELAEQIVGLRADVPVALCTGFSNSQSGSPIEPDRFCAVIRKPIVMRELAETVRTVLHPSEN